MRKPRTQAMRDYWDERARVNAAFYVDTSLDYDAPDLTAFIQTGRRIRRIALDDAPVRPPRFGTAVEIGCGLGRVCVALRERFEQVIGYDIAPEMLARAVEFVDDPAIELRLTDGASLPGLADESVDFVVTFTVFQHVPDFDIINAYVAEAGRVLRPGGVFAVQWNNTPGVAAWRIRRAALGWRQQLGRGDRYGRDHREFLGSRVALATMDDALRHAGLRRVGLRDPGQLFTWAWAQR